MCGWLGRGKRQRERVVESASESVLSEAGRGGVVQEQAAEWGNFGNGRTDRSDHPFRVDGRSEGAVNSACDVEYRDGAVGEPARCHEARCSRHRSVP